MEEAQRRLGLKKSAGAGQAAPASPAPHQSKRYDYNNFLYYYYFITTTTATTTTTTNSITCIHVLTALCK
jgi:hypothetical protein